MKKILVVGSVSFDVIFGVYGDIRKEIPIKDGQINDVNLMFTAKNKNQYLGGTGGNIAYGLGLLGSNPILFSVVGKDFTQANRNYLMNNNVNLKLIEKEGEHTAIFYGISDEHYQQIGIWQPNAYGDWIEKVKLTDTISQKDLSEFDFAIFSPGTGLSIKNHLLELRRFNKNVKIIFDPSQVLSIFFDKELLIECLKLSNYFIGNETEITQLNTIFGLKKNDILNYGIEAIIETLGEKGSVVYTKNKKINIDIFKPKRIVETTGAGDAFRSGFIYGLSINKSIENACKIGAFMGAKCVEELSGQIYKIDKNEMQKLN